MSKKLGVISADVAGGTIVLNAQPFTNLGVVKTPGGALNVGVLENTGGVLVADVGTGSLNLVGGTIRGGTIMTTNGTAVLVSALTLDGVRVDGELDVGTVNNGASLTVVNGLELNGTLRVGNPTNSWYGVVHFSGTQTLGGNGTVIFGDSPERYNALRLTTGGTTLTLGPGVTVRGKSGTIGYSSIHSGPQNVGVVNQGVISADVAGGNITIQAQPFTNAGLVRSPAGTVNLAGTTAAAGLGNFQSVGGAMQLSGRLNNTNETLTLEGSGNVFTMQGGVIAGGTLIASNGARLVFGNGTLDGVRVDGELDVGTVDNGASLTVVNGLELNGTLRVGNPTNNWYGVVHFSGTQTLGGNGTVIFGGSPDEGYNALRLTTGGTTLTLGPGVTVRGKNGTIGYSSIHSGPQNVGVTNQGTISADVSGGTIHIRANPFVNNGTTNQMNGGTLLINP